MILLLSASLAFAAPTFVLLGTEQRVDLAGGFVPRAKAIVDTGLVDHLSLTTTFGVSPGYAEAYFGPTWSPTTHFSLGVAGGMETDADPWRVMTYSTASHKGFRTLGVVEYGGSGLWYKAVTSYTVEPVSIGAMLQRSDGLGPRIAVSRWELELWTAPLYDVESQKPCLLIGANWVPE